MRLQILERVRKADEIAILFSIIACGGILVFVSTLLGIHILYYSIPALAEAHGIPVKSDEREVGLLFALNWVLFFVLFMPLIIICFKYVVDYSYNFIRNIAEKRGEHFISLENDIFHTPATNLWKYFCLKMS